MDEQADELIGTDVIHSYGRQEALDDGVFTDVTEMAKEAGFKWPVAMTSNLLNTWITPTDKAKAYGQDFEGRLWDVLNMLRYAIARQSEPDRFVKFDVLFQDGPELRNRHKVTLWSVSGPGDHAEPVITIMLPEDY